MYRLVLTLLVTAIASSPTLKPDRQTTVADDAAGATSRAVKYSARDVVQLYGQLRFTTLIVLPQDEQILDFVCGDKDFWIINGTQNFAYVKPAKAGAQTNLNLVTSSGTVYSFLLTEISDAHGQRPDLKVYVERKEESVVVASTAKPTFVPAQQLDDFRVQIDIAKEEARKAAQRADDRVAAFQEAYPLKLRFGYRFQAERKPFMVSAMYHDGRFTYIQAHTTEPPTLYEIKDGKASLVDYQFRDGVYVVGKVLEVGYLAIGNRRLPFSRAD
jgi:type IV secretory pathway VirB9-like protein